MGMYSMYSLLCIRVHLGHSEDAILRPHFLLASLSFSCVALHRGYGKMLASLQDIAYEQWLVHGTGACAQRACLALFPQDAQ